MSADLYSRAPYRVRHGTQATVEDRHGAGALLVIEPVHSPAERIAFAEAWCAQVNAEADRRRALAAERPALPQAAE